MNRIRRWWNRLRGGGHRAVLGDGHACLATTKQTCPECGWKVLGFVDEASGGTVFMAPVNTPPPPPKEF